MALLSNTFESGADGDTVLIANSASPDPVVADAITTGASVQFSTAQKQKGSKSMRFVYNNTAGQAGIRFTQASAAAANAIRFYFRFASLPSTTGMSLFTLHVAALTDRRCYVTVDNVGSLRMYDFLGTANFISANGAIAVNTWYRLELGITAVTGSAGTSDLRVYLGDDLTSIPALDSSLTAQNYGGSALANIQIGRFEATTPAANGTATLYYDDFAWNSGSATLLGPSSVPSTTTVTYGTHVHIG
jgi:hypothetical protein